MIPTAKEFVQQMRDECLVDFMRASDRQKVEDKLVEFAKLYVEAALKAVTKLDLDDITIMPEANDFEESRELHILNAYPLTNIQ